MNAFIVRRRKENLFSSSTAAAAPPSSDDKEREDFTLLYFLGANVASWSSKGVREETK